MSASTRMLGGLRPLLSSHQLPTYWQLLPFALGILGLLLVWRIAYAFLFSPLRKIPGPLAARLSSMRGDRDNFSGRVAETVAADQARYGDVFLYKPHAVCVSHPDDVRAVLESHEFRKTDFFALFDDGGTPNIVSLREPSRVGIRRRQIGPYLAYGYLRRMETVILQYGYEALRRKWDDLLSRNDGRPTEVNYRVDTQLATFDIMSALAFGREPLSVFKGDSSISRWTSAIMGLLDSPLVLGLLSILPFWLVMWPWKRMYRELAHYSHESAEMRRELLASGAEKPADMLQAFIDAEDPESKAKMSPAERQAESIMMMLAGSETTSSAVMYVFHLLLLHPRALECAVKEVRAAFRPGHLIRHQDVLVKLPYTEACVYEALRRSPTTAGLTPRVSRTRGITLRGGQYIPAGVEIYVNLRSVNMHPDLWPEPHRFEPERFLGAGGEEAKRALFTFSYGPRNCIGRNLAWVEMLTIVANVLKDYDLALPEGSEFGPHNVDELGQPRLLPAKCFIASFPANPERDCRMIITRAGSNGGPPKVSGRQEPGLVAP